MRKFKEDECVMCGEKAVFSEKNGELLCGKCAEIDYNIEKSRGRIN